MTKFGKAWENYFNTASKLGAVEVFPNPDKSLDKSFITSGVYKMWLDEQKRKKLGLTDTTRTQAISQSLKNAGITEDELMRMR
jgi:hypothetical protein